MNLCLNYIPVLVLGMLALSCASGADVDTSGTATSTSPYAGEEIRQIKALSAERMEGLLAGSGLGYAKVAELNGYPGPKHVLELADSLHLTEEQRVRSQETFERMHERAGRLGATLVRLERDLDHIFNSGGPVDTAAARATMLEIGHVDAELRWTHISAHLGQVDILTPHQRQRYAELRGYDTAHEHAREHENGHEM